jgi:preprotein translocase subunit YajC
MSHAYDFAKKKYNIEIDPTEIDRNVAMGPRKPGSGKANAYRLLDKTGKKAIQVQVANLDNKRYELNMYKEDVDQIDEDVKSAAEKIETYAKTLSTGDMDKKDFMKVASMLKRNKVKDAIKFTMSLDSDPRDYVIDVMQNNKINMKEEVELTEKGPGLWANIRAKRARGEKMRKPGEKGAPTEDQIRSAKNEEFEDVNESQFKPGYEFKAPGYDRRVQELENKGMTTSDAQGVADAEVRSGKHKNWKQSSKKNMKEEVELTESHFKPGQRVMCIKSGMKGTVIKVNKPEVGKYYDVTLDSGKKMKYAPDELKLIGKKEVNESDASWAKSKEMEKEKRLTPLDKDKLAKIRVMMGKEKKPMKEEIKLTEKVLPAQIDRMRQEYDKIKGIDPASDNYKKLTTMLDKLDLKTLQTLAGAKIKFVSGLAQNRVVRKMNEEVEELDELSKDTLKSYTDKASSGKDVHNNPKKNWLNRISGLGRASEKLKKEEIDLEEGYEKTVLDFLDKRGFNSADFRDGNLYVSKSELAGVKKALQRATGFNAKDLKVIAEEQIDEISADVAKRVAQKRDQDFRKNTPTATQKRRMGRGDWRADPQLHADKARQSAEKRGAKDVYDYHKKEEVEFDEASNPQVSMKRAGLSVQRAKEVMRHQKEIGSIRKKREALRNSYDPAIIEAYKKMKGKKKNEVTKDDNQAIKSSDKLSGKQEPIELDPELKEQKT